jgi:hypothetical protein
MSQKSDPRYIHYILGGVIIVLIYVLAKVAILDPTETVAKEEYFKRESRLRMKNLKEAEVLWFQKHNKFTDNLDSLVNFIKTDAKVQKLMVGIDSLTKRTTNPFVKLSSGEFTPDSLFKTPKSQVFYKVMIDTSVNADTIINRTGKIVKIDSSITLGSRYSIEDPDKYGSVGDLYNDALKNVLSWE